MHNTWLVLRLMWTAAIVVYLALIIIPRPISPWEKRVNSGLFVVVVAFVWIRIFGRYVFHGGLIFQYALVLAGIAAAIGILVRITALIAARSAAESKLKADS